ncbi:MAG: Prevent-host-death family protein [Microgenomates group bacterium GW2011_GWA2_46_7]|nr:MAG: Prevent-host-death family protein [Microgenomates group bacterium GW2011_GWA2_46_7]
MNTLTLTQMRANLPSLVASVADNLERFVVTVSGEPRAVLVSADELASLEETAEVMSMVDLKALRAGITQARKKQGISLSNL